MKQYIIETIEDYPDNGSHQECYIGLPFEIRKGEDGYHYINRKGKELKYNIYKSETKVEDRWICYLTEGANQSLESIFEVKVNRDLDVIIKYCVQKYKKSLKLEMKRINKELSLYV